MKVRGQWDWTSLVSVTSQIHLAPFTKQNRIIIRFPKQVLAAPAFLNSYISDIKFYVLKALESKSQPHELDKIESLNLLNEKFPRYVKDDAQAVHSPAIKQTKLFHGERHCCKIAKLHIL